MRRSAPLARANLAVAVSGPRAAFSAQLADGSYIVDVFQFQPATGSWGFLQRMLPRPENSEPRFGAGLAMNGDELLIGGARNPESAPAPLPAGARLGYVDHYRFSGSEYGFVRTLVPSPPSSAGDPSSQTDFGVTLDIASGMVVVGAPFFAANVGAAFVFDLESGLQTTFLQEPDASILTEQRYATVVRATVGRIVVGKPRLCAGGGGPRPCKGQVFVYEPRGTAWTMMEAIESPAPIPGDGSTFTDSFGSALAIDGEWMAIANGDPAGGGRKVYIYNRSMKGDCLSPSPGTRCWIRQQSIELVASIPSQGMALSQDILLWSEPSGGAVASTGEPTTVLQFLRRGGASFALEGQIVAPTANYSKAVDLDGLHFVASVSEQSLGALFGSYRP